jgi:hypothetical protein
MSYDIPSIYSVNPDTANLIEHALKCSGIGNDGDEGAPETTAMK